MRAVSADCAIASASYPATQGWRRPWTAKPPNGPRSFVARGTSAPLRSAPKAVCSTRPAFPRWCAGRRDVWATSLDEFISVAQLAACDRMLERVLRLCASNPWHCPSMSGWAFSPATPTATAPAATGHDQKADDPRLQANASWFARVRALRHNRSSALSLGCAGAQACARTNAVVAASVASTTGLTARHTSSSANATCGVVGRSGWAWAITDCAVCSLPRRRLEGWPRRRRPGWRLRRSLAAVARPRRVVSDGRW